MNSIASIERKILLVGNESVGKTTFVKKLLELPFETHHIYTLGVEIYPVDVGNIKYIFWDTAGEDCYGGLQDGYYLNADAAIIMCDGTSKQSQKAIPAWISKVLNVAPNAKIIICVNKSDLPGEISRTLQCLINSNQ